MSLVYPRLRPAAAVELAEQIRSSGLPELRQESKLIHPEIEFYTSGVRVAERQLAAVQSSIRELLDRLGFPNHHGGNIRLINTFDREAASLLNLRMDIITADAAAPDVWSFMTLVLLPDAAIWRYPDGDLDRLLGGPRNILRRLWWRAYVLGAGPTDPPARLGEDQLVQIMERPTIGGNPRVARSFCGAYLRNQDTHSQLPRMEWMRDAAKRVIRFTAFMALDALEDSQLDALMDEIVIASAGSFGTTSDTVPS